MREFKPHIIINILTKTIANITIETNIHFTEFSLYDFGDKYDKYIISMKN